MLDEHMAGTRPRQWNAKWIWPADMAADESNVYCQFRKTFDLEQKPEGHSLFISADRFYQVCVNGEWLGHGPPPAQPWYHFYDEYDLSERLRDLRLRVLGRERPVDVGNVQGHPEFHVLRLGRLSGGFPHSKPARNRNHRAGMRKIERRSPKNRFQLSGRVPDSPRRRQGGMP